MSGVAKGLAATVGFAAMIAQPLAAAEVSGEPFGKLPDGRPVQAFTLSNGKGVSARVLTWGAILQALVVPDRDGKGADIVLGYADLAGYLADTNYFGASVGRYANRIKAGAFTLDGQPYQLAKNDGPNALHGGTEGFNKKLWQVLDVRRGDVASVTLQYVSADGEEGYPGELTVTATYALNDANELSIEYKATTTKPTIVNLTNHSYFNLLGEASERTVLDHRLTIPAEAFTPIDATLIPTGELKPVSGTPFDFRSARPIRDGLRDGRDPQVVFGKGYDHNFVVLPAPTADTHLIARVDELESGRVMEVLSNQPGVQFYSGNFLDGGTAGKSGRLYRQTDALVLEPQIYPDTPNRPNFGSARLDPGQTYRNLIVYRFSTSERDQRP